MINITDFVLIKPRRVRYSKQTKSNTVRVRFTKNKSVSNLNIIFGESIAEKLKIKQGDHISISYHKDDKRCFLIKKIDSIDGYLIRKNGKKSRQFMTAMSGSFLSPTEDDFRTKSVKFDISDDCIIINIWGCEIMKYKKTHEIYIGAFDCRITCHFYGSFEELKKLSKEENLEEKPYCLTVNGDYHLYFTKEFSINEVIHKSFHCVFRLFKSIKLLVDDQDMEEIYAYHISYIAESILNFVKKNKIAKETYITRERI